LADLSRNASVISSSSSSDSTSSLILNTPRPRPARNFSSPRTRSPQTASRNTSRPPTYLTGGLGRRDDHITGSSTIDVKRGAAGARSQSRNRSVNGAQDYEFGEELGEGSYSTVRHCNHIAN
jgi:3-phosphoinositide dependent protein kinase-1